MESTYDGRSRTAELSSEQKVYNFHPSTSCEGEFCPVHKPSDHQFRSYPLSYDSMSGSFFRVVEGETVVDPDDYVLNQTGKVIVRNSAKCLSCGDEPVSTHRHDFRRCKCGEMAVDGGSAYLRRVGNFEDTSIIFHKE